MFTHLTRSIFLTGVLSPPILVNSSNPIRTSQYSVQMSENINIDHLYMQGGPGKGIAEFNKKIVGGDIKFTPRITEANTIDPAMVELINSAQDYKSSFTITTFLLPYDTGLTANQEPYRFSVTEPYSLVFDTCVAEKLTLRAKKDGDVEATMSIKGQTDESFTTPLSPPSEDTNLYRNLSWFDCYFARQGSQIENLHEIEVSVVKTIDQKYFLMTFGDPTTFDRPYSTGVKAVEVNFKIVEHITSVYDVFTYSFGGFLDGFNLSGNFGPISFSIPNAVLKISSENLTPDIIERTTEGFYRLIPNTPETADFLFQI